MFKNKEEFKFEFSRRIIESYGRTVEEAHITEKFMVLETMVRDYASVNWAASKAVVQNNEHVTILRQGCISEEKIREVLK